MKVLFIGGTGLISMASTRLQEAAADTALFVRPVGKLVSS
jgi:hypothetical protein